MRLDVSRPWKLPSELLQFYKPKGSPCSRLTARLPQSDSRLKLLQHYHLVGDLGDGITNYDVADCLQEKLRGEFFHWKNASEKSTHDSRSHPHPHLLSFESTPTFTLGRRQGDLTPEETYRLQQTLRVELPQRRGPFSSRRFTPDVRKTNRGGLTTYHGPGQLVLWPVLDMHSPLYTKYGVASYATHLEWTTQKLLAELYGIQTYTIRHEPGVWVVTPRGQQRKIAAMGVHHRRHVTALGIAINMDVPVAGPEDVNPWARFVPCGLDGKTVTSVAAEVASTEQPWELGDLAAIAERWGTIFEDGLIHVAKRKDQGQDA